MATELVVYEESKLLDIYFESCKLWLAVHANLNEVARRNKKCEMMKKHESLSALLSYKLQ